MAVLVATAAGLPLAATPSASASVDPPPDRDAMMIKIASVSGSGCPFGTAAVTVADDDKSFAVTYGDYTAQAGGASAPARSRKTCQLALKVYVPKNVTYGIISTDHRGYAFLQDGARATHSAGAYFHGQAREMTAHEVNGPYDSVWQFTDQSDLGEFLWKPCGQDPTFDISTELRVDKGGSDPSKANLIAMDATDGTMKTTYHLAWKACP
ncbi:DUF4360 domain-containing protein [Actinomadura chibensis]|uniref:DUF4360 domain-containing protein n=2 Tax=Actinomadura chibensis TaxID=392828 RepID=A0A5D0NRL7_9ACTN|nr:DUF4360 domain-containing protein [Actinomadura chibensis]